jgi:hypothetical protein
MSRRGTVVKLATKAAILFGALFLVTVLIAAIPAHQQKPFEVVITPEQQPSQDLSAPSRPPSQSADAGSLSNKISNRASTTVHRSNRTYKSITRPKSNSGVASPQ